MSCNFTHIYCHNCKSINQSVTDSVFYEDVTGNYAGKDICCSKCLLVLATVYIRNDV
jgi:hypothetical protein